MAILTQRGFAAARIRRPIHARRRSASLLLAVSMALLLAGITPQTSVALSVVPPGDPSGLGFKSEPSTSQAGAHPDLVTSFTISPLPTAEEVIGKGSPLKDAIVDLPAGQTGNPEAAAKCTETELGAGPTGNGVANCPQASQVGVVEVLAGVAPDISFPLGTVGLYVMKTSPNELATLGFNIIGAAVHLDASVRPTDNGLTLTSHNIFQLFPVSTVTVTVWGVPADPSHDQQRCANLNPANQLCDGSGGGAPDTTTPHSAGIPRAPFLTNPTSCGVPQSTRISVASWQAPGLFETVVSEPQTMTGCQKLPFDPEVDIQPDTARADAPTGLDATVTIPQNENPDGVGTAHLRTVSVPLPEGVSISASSADGLAACSDEMMSIGSDTPAACPPASKIGTVTAETPLLADPVQGSIYVGTQRSDDPTSGEMFRLFLELRGPGGLIVKLLGHVRADADTGQLLASFNENPQLPVSKIELQLKSGSRAPLGTPPTCGQKSLTGQFASWAGQQTLASDSFVVDCPGVHGFSLGFDAGTRSGRAGAFSPLAVNITRQDGQEYLSGVSLRMPPGVLGKLRGVELCPDAQAAAGTCSSASRVGSATVSAGVGANPMFLKGGVYLTGPYRGAPYGLSVAVPAIAGPFDLGMVVVRQAIFIDPVDAHLTVQSDPLPRIVKGVPVRLRSVTVETDRPSFTFNPTSCAEKRIDGTLQSTFDSAAAVSQRFQVGDCGLLKLTPRMRLALNGSRQTTDGQHPGLTARLTQGPGQSGIKRVEVKLPLSLALDPSNAEALCEFEDGQRGHCPKASIIGQAKATTPVLNRPLRGPVYFVKGIRIDRKTGRKIRTLPTLYVPLRGEVAIDLRARSAVKNQHLVTTFDAVPDAPVSAFDLKLQGGKNGILVVSNADVCRGKQVADVDITGHSGARRLSSSAIHTPCRKK
jgi:hypothetical protein